MKSVALVTTVFPTIASFIVDDAVALGSVRPRHLPQPGQALRRRRRDT